jgi:hypothetical protein
MKLIRDLVIRKIKTRGTSYRGFTRMSADQENLPRRHREEQTCTRLVLILKSSGADSSGLTEAMPKILSSVDVRLSEQHVVVWTLCLA